MLEELTRGENCVAEDWSSSTRIKACHFSVGHEKPSANPLVVAEQECMGFFESTTMVVDSADKGIVPWSKRRQWRCLDDTPMERREMVRLSGKRILGVCKYNGGSLHATAGPPSIVETKIKKKTWGFVQKHWSRYMCWGLDFHLFPVLGDGHEPQNRGFICSQ